MTGKNAVLIEKSSRTSETPDQLGNRRQNGRRVPRSDADLVASAASGDQGAWNMLVERYGRLIWSITANFGLSSADANDVSQVTWLNLFSSLDRLTDPNRVGFWLCTTAKRECLGLIKRRGRSVPIGDDEWLIDRPTIDAGPAELAIRAGGDPTMRSAFGKLSRDCRRLLSMLAAEPPASYETVAQAFDISLGTIGSKRKRCVDRLRTLYDRAHEDQAHEDQAHEDQAHEDQAHEDQAHEDQAHEVQKHQLGQQLITTEVRLNVH